MERTAAAKVSVALCTHNGERFLGEQLSSILGQSRLPDEIVVSDDASTDSTRALVAEISMRRDLAGYFAPRFRLIDNDPALGVTANFQRAITACTGEIVILSDQDDVWHPDRIEVALEFFARRPALLLLHGDAALIDETGAPLGVSLFEAQDVDAEVQSDIHSGRAFEQLLRRNFVTGATTAFRRSLVDLASPFPEGWIHDEWLAIVASAVGEIDLTPLRLVDYRQHGGNQLGAQKLGMLGKVRRMLEPGSSRNARLFERATSLAERLPQLPVEPQSRIVASSEKLLHEQMRSALRPPRLRRVRPILRELRTGRYTQFGRGTADAIRDLLQPLTRGD